MYRTFEEKKRKITSAPPSKAPMPLSPQPPGNHHLPTPPTTDLCKPEVCIKVNLIIFLKKTSKKIKLPTPPTTDLCKAEVCTKCQKTPTIEAKETYSKGKKRLTKAQMWPTITGIPEVYISVKRDLELD